MAVKIRLTRAGAKKAPFYRIVAADSRAPRDGRFIEVLGRYNPRTDPSFIEMDIEKVEAWIAKGAQMSDTVARLLVIAKSPDGPKPTGKVKVSKKAAAKAEADKKAAEKPVEKPAAVEVAEAPAEEAAAPEAEAEEAPAEEAAAPEAEAEEAPAEEAAEPEVEAEEAVTEE